MDGARGWTLTVLGVSLLVQRAPFWETRRLVAAGVGG